MSTLWDNRGSHPNHPPECVLAEKSDYEGGDPDLSLVKRPDGLYDFIIYRGTNDLTVHALTAGVVREAARRILELVPEVAEQPASSHVLDSRTKHKM